MNVLLFEFVGDDFNQAMRNDPDVARAADGRLLHPILVQIGRAHTSEEARHIAYPRRWLTEGMPGLSDQEVFEVQSLAQLGAQSLIDRKAFLPVKWTNQLAHYMTKEEFAQARGVSPASRLMLGQLKRLLDEFEELRVVSSVAMRQWEDAGAFG